MQLAGDPAAHDLAGRLIAEAFGDRTHRPATDCAPMDWGLTAASLAGKVVVVAGNAWGDVVHTLNWEEKGAGGFTGCTHSTLMTRYLEDRTWVAVAAEPTGEGSPSEITPAMAAAMAAWGVNLIGLDQLTPEDPRLAALVWSWAPDEPRAGAGACTFQGDDGRFRVDDCGERRPAACRAADGSWTVTRRVVTWAGAADACRAETSSAVPATASTRTPGGGEAATGRVGGLPAAL